MSLKLSSNGLAAGASEKEGCLSDIRDSKQTQKNFHKPELRHPIKYTKQVTDFFLIFQLSVIFFKLNEPLNGNKLTMAI